MKTCAALAIAMSARVLLPLVAATVLAVGPASPALGQTSVQPVAAGSVETPPLGFQKRMLPNGLEVWTLQDAGTSDVTVQLWYRVGSKDDPQNRSGFAHLFEHLMFKATRNLPDETWDELVENVGGIHNAGTFPDFTWYFEVVPANHLERILFAEAERMGSLVVNEASFASETGVVQEEFRQRVLADPYGRLFSLYLRRELYREHPYRRPGIGSLEDLAAATVEDVRRFHATYYRPDNAVLVVAGDFDQAQLDGWIDRYFVGLKNPDRPIPTNAVVEPEPTAPREATYYAPNVPLPAVVVGWSTVAYDSEDRAALTVLNGVLATGQSSRLFRSLVYDKQISASIASSADFNKQTGALSAHAMMTEGHDVAEGEAAILAEVARLRDEPVSETELQEAKTELIADILRGRETVDDKAYALGVALMMTGDAAVADAEVARIQAVTAADVQGAAQRYLTPERRVVVRYLDESRRPEGAADEATLAATEAPVTLADLTNEYEVIELAPQAERQAMPEPAQERAVETPAVVERKMPNGMRVYVARTEGVPLVSARLSFATGSADDPPMRTGLASLTASLLTQGAAGRSAPEIASEIERLGAVVGATPGTDFTSVYANSPNDTFSRTFALLTELVRHPTFSQEELDRQRTQALAGVRVDLSQPMMTAYAATPRAVYGDAPYGAPVKGTASGLAAITRDDIAAFHAANWRPGNATLVFSGDIEPEAAFALAEAAFGDWAEPATPAVLASDPAGPPVAPRVIVVDMPGAGQAAVYLGARAIARTHADYYPLVVGNSLLGGGFSGRLNRVIRIERGLAYYALSGFLPREDDGITTAFTQTRNDAVPEVVSLMLAEVDRLSTEQAAPADLASRRAVLVGSYGRGLETVDGLGAAVAGLANYGLPMSELQAYVPKVRGVSGADLQRAAAAHLPLSSFSIVVVGDAAQFLDALRAAHPNVEVIPVPELNLDKGSLR